MIKPKIAKRTWILKFLEFLNVYLIPLKAYIKLINTFWDVLYDFLLLFKSFNYAFSGISYVLKTSRNFKIQLIFAVTSLIIGFLLKISLSNYVILIATIMSVLILEILNTSIESIVDLVVKKEFSILAKISKDTSAGAVLLASINSVIIAVYIFVPKIKLLF